MPCGPKLGRTFHPGEQGILAGYRAVALETAAAGMAS
jgi:hypothetical protein